MDETTNAPENSILIGLRNTVCGSNEVADFDVDLIMHANATFSKLHQLGAGPDYGFEITGIDEAWDDYSTDSILVNLVKTYLYLNIRLIFDPPTNSFTLESIKKLIDEYEWRINVMVDPGEEG